MNKEKACNYYSYRLFLWSEWRDLNPRPLGPEPSALPTALHPDILLLPLPNPFRIWKLIYYMKFFLNCQSLFSIDTHCASSAAHRPTSPIKQNTKEEYRPRHSSSQSVSGPRMRLRQRGGQGWQNPFLQIDRLQPLPNLLQAPGRRHGPPGGREIRQ